MLVNCSLAGPTQENTCIHDPSQTEMEILSTKYQSFYYNYNDKGASEQQSQHSNVHTH